MISPTLRANISRALNGPYFPPSTPRDFKLYETEPWYVIILLFDDHRYSLLYAVYKNVYKFERLRLFAIFRRLNAKGIKEEFETTRYIYDFDAFEIRRSYHVGKKIFYNILVISVSWFLKLLLPTVGNESIRTLAFAIFHELK